MNLTQPTVGTKPWNLDDLFSNFNDIGTEVETARESSGSLYLNLTVNYATKAWTSGQIASGGVDWSTIANPQEFLAMNSAGDTPKGLTVANDSIVIYNSSGIASTMLITDLNNDFSEIYKQFSLEGGMY